MSVIHLLTDFLPIVACVLGAIGVLLGRSALGLKSPEVLQAVTILLFGLLLIGVNESVRKAWMALFVVGYFAWSLIVFSRIVSRCKRQAGGSCERNLPPPRA